MVTTEMCGPLFLFSFILTFKRSHRKLWLKDILLILHPYLRNPLPDVSLFWTQNSQAPTWLKHSLLLLLLEHNLAVYICQLCKFILMH